MQLSSLICANLDTLKSSLVINPCPTFGPVRSAHPQTVMRDVSASLDPVVVQLGFVGSLKKTKLKLTLLNSALLI